MHTNTAVAVAIVMTVGAMRVGRRDDNGGAAIATLRAIHSAQETFASWCAAGRYAPSLESLATPPRGTSTGFIALDLGTSRFYDVMLAPGPEAQPVDSAS